MKPTGHLLNHGLWIISVVIGMSTLPACSSTLSTGRIAFYSSEAGKYGAGKSDIYTINPDGSGLMHLAKYASNPVWSPDGKQIAFEGAGIEIMNMDGSHRKSLISSDGIRYSSPTWSPDGKRIAFESYDDYGRIYAINSDGSGLEPATEGADEREPKWSPDGQRIVFLFLREHHDAGFKIAIVNTETGGSKILTDGYPGHDLNPVWSPDGRKLAFFSGADGQINLIDMEEAIQPSLGGPTTMPVTSIGVFPLWSPPAWSPDGKQLAFVSKRDDNAEIYVVNLETSDETRLTSNSTDDISPAWSPDGKQIAFVSKRDGNQEIYVMNADGSNQTRLTNTPEDEWTPVWQPR